MRVLMLSWEYPPHVIGGLGKHVVELVPALASQGVEVYVLTPGLHGGAEYEQPRPGINIIRVPLSLPEPGQPFVDYVLASNQQMFEIAEQLQQAGPAFDLIHAHEWLAAPAAIALKHRWRVPLIATIHATERGRGRGQLVGEHAERINGIEWQLCYEAWRVIGCSEFMARQIQEYFGVPADKIDVVPNGINLHPSPFESAAEREDFRRQYVQDSQALVLFVGRVVHEKGLHLLLEAWPGILAEQAARLVIAGTGSMFEVLRRRSAELAIDESVFFCGFISDAERDRLYHAADLAVFPSLYEPFGIVALEAMAAGCPVIAAATGGLREVVNSANGTLVPADNPAALTQAVLQSLANPEQTRRQTEQACNEVRERYNWRQIAQMTLEVYQRVQRDYQQSTWGKHP